MTEDTWQAATADKLDYCTECEAHLKDCQCVLQYCGWCSQAFVDATYWPYCCAPCAVQADCEERDEQEAG